jgi:hypothetical protein
MPINARSHNMTAHAVLLQLLARTPRAFDVVFFGPERISPARMVVAQIRAHLNTNAIPRRTPNNDM